MRPEFRSLPEAAPSGFQRIATETELRRDRERRHMAEAGPRREQNTAAAPLRHTEGLSRAQREAVTHGEGPLLVLAGPGSGKTFVITRRIRYLIDALKVDPRRILVLTFSRAAAREMEERFAALQEDMPSCEERPYGGGRPVFGTFHSFFFRILRTAYGYAADQVIADGERVNILTGLVRQLRIESGDIRTLVQNLLSEIAVVKEERAELPHYYSVSCPAEQFRELFCAYERALGERQKIDYEDMLLMTYELLKERDDIRTALQQRWQWLLVDEFQDINRLQYEIVRMIAAARSNLTVVGDDDQSIYRFRGAKPELMLGFRGDFPDARQLLLDINFRSTPEIVKTAGRLIRRNKKRFEKEITAHRASGKPVNTVVCPDPGREAAYIVAEIRRHIAEGMQYGDIAVLYRTNLQPRLLSARLMAENIPFRIREMLPDLMEHWIARDVVAYLRLARHIAEPGDLLRIMNRPNRYIRREALRMEGETLEGIYAHYEKSGEQWMRERLDRLSRDLRHLSRLTVYEAISWIRQEIGYERFLLSYAEEHEIEPGELLEILDELQDSAEGFRFPEEWLQHSRDFRQELMQRRERAARSRDGEKTGQRQAEEYREDTDQLHLMTFHASKGLEFPLVFLIDVNEGIVPHRKACGRDELEEERRMFYVAMTRAKDELVVCTCKKRFHRAVEESRFIAEYETPKG
ncbi:DNA helicase-2/ATP-dependent DNA helicase PcrA [Fusobacterium naviforme]|nr:DNA helicase-2/ATP-dependent DNA helicase PcrA [Fusobacterium naviforme]STO26639.1 Putative ATP-dependent DNA helicase yjcD [Fusobacterium naviforme]